MGASTKGSFREIYWEPSQAVLGLEDASVEPSIWYGAFDEILLEIEW